LCSNSKITKKGVEVLYKLRDCNTENFTFHKR